MALDGLSNQSVGIYRSKDPSKTTDKLTYKSKEMAERRVSDVDEAFLVEKTDPDDSHQNKNTDNAFFAPDNLEKNDEENKNEIINTDFLEEKNIQYQIDEYNSKENPEFFVSFNENNKMIELKNINTNEIIQSIKPQELLKVLSKAKDISGMFIDKEI